MAGAGDSPGRKMHVRVSADLHRLMRIRCAELDLTIQDFVVKLLERELSPAGFETPGGPGLDENERR